MGTCRPRAAPSTMDAEAGNRLTGEHQGKEMG